MRLSDDLLSCYRFDSMELKQYVAIANLVMKLAAQLRMTRRLPLPMPATKRN